MKEMARARGGVRTVNVILVLPIAVIGRVPMFKVRLACLRYSLYVGKGDCVHKKQVKGPQPFHRVFRSVPPHCVRLIVMELSVS